MPLTEAELDRLPSPIREAYERLKTTTSSLGDSWLLTIHTVANHGDGLVEQRQRILAGLDVRMDAIKTLHARMVELVDVAIADGNVEMAANALTAVGNVMRAQEAQLVDFLDAYTKSGGETRLDTKGCN